MATAHPSGFTPVANLTGGGEYIRTSIHAAGDNVAVGRFDFVTPTGAVNTVEQYDHADAVLGVALNYVPLSVLGNVSVYHINHTTIFEAEEDSVGGNIAAASEGLNCDVIVAAANTTTGLSQMMIDSSQVATSNTLDLRLHMPVRRPGNTIPTASGRWFCSALILHIAEAKAGI